MRAKRLRRGKWCQEPFCFFTLWAASYNYDLAGDLTSWNHPAGFTITQAVDGARHITQVTSSLSDATHPATLATGANNSIQYTAWGAVSQLQHGCVGGAGCAPIQETYFYNKRLQMAVGELGVMGNHPANACRVYNYYVGVSNATACSETPSNWPTGTNNNGDAAGYYYQDNMDFAHSHSATYTYDTTNRLATAAATGGEHLLQPDLWL